MGKSVGYFLFLFFHFLGFFDRKNLRNSCQENFTCPEILLINSTIGIHQMPISKKHFEFQNWEHSGGYFSHFTKADFWNFYLSENLGIRIMTQQHLEFSDREN